MAKKLKELKAKLGELQGPEDNTVATRNFYRKHKTVEHPDPAGNGDDVFKASNVRTAERSPNHGYEPGKDEEVYEDIGGYSDLDIKRKELRKAAARAFRAAPVANDDGFKRDETSQWDHANAEVEAGTQASSRKGLAITSTAKAARKKLTNSYEPQGNKINEMFGKKTLKLGSKNAPQDPAQQEWMKNHPLNNIIANQLPRGTKVKSTEQAKSEAEKIMRSSGWKNGERVMRATNDSKDKKGELAAAARYYGILKQSYDPKIAEIFEHLSEENKKHFIDILGEEDGYERIAEAFGLAEEE